MRSPAGAELRPLHRWCPPQEDTLGDLAVKVGMDLGLTPDAEQTWLLEAIYAENDPGLPSAYEVCVVAPRQNLKSATLEVAALTDLFVIGVPLSVWTAHEFKTARKSFEDMRTRIMRHPDYAARTQFRDSHGEEAIFLDTGERLEFHARSGGSGRGFTCDRLTLDEAMYLQPGDLGALVPTMFTRPDAQVRYGSSAGKQSSTALRALRERGRAGGDLSLTYVEYGATRRPCATGDRCTHALGSAGCALDDVEAWWQANCALWAGRADEDAVQRQRRALPPAEFAREFLSWWEDPPTDQGTADFASWTFLADPSAPRGASPVFGVATASDESWSAVAVAWRRPDGAGQVMIADYRPGAGWLKDRTDELRAQWGGTVVLDRTAVGAAVGERVKSEQVAPAHNAFARAVVAGTVRHGNQAELNVAVRAARWKPSGDTRVLDRKGSADISPLIAAALAVHGLSLAPTSTYEDRELVVL